MFSTLKERILLGIYIFLILSIPIGAYLASEFQTTTKSRAVEEKPKATAIPTPSTATSSAKQLLKSVEEDLEKIDSTPAPDSQATTIATNFGPTLKLKAALEGRTVSQATKLFIGIIEGSILTNPKFLLSFTIDLPLTGEYSGLSLAGLQPGSSYTALIKGSASLAAATSFVMSPAETNLNSGEVIDLIIGDLNEDNVINSADYSIVQKAFGASSTSSNWNELADFNQDGIINVFDLGLVSKNLGQVGASGAWTSPLPQTATPSGAITPQGSSSGGYWIWVPGI